VNAPPQRIGGGFSPRGGELQATFSLLFCTPSSLYRYVASSAGSPRRAIDGPAARTNRFLPIATPCLNPRLLSWEVSSL
jgi:hypothetical protein